MKENGRRLLEITLAHPGQRSQWGLDSIAAESELAFRQSVDELNALSTQLERVNSQLNRKSRISDQPPGVLDERDTLLRKMSALAKLGVRELPNGQVQVNFGGEGRGYEIVTANESKQVAIFSNDKSDGSDLRLVLDPYGAKRPLPLSPSGSIGGALAFRTEVLRPVRIWTGFFGADSFRGGKYGSSGRT